MLARPQKHLTFALIFLAVAGLRIAILATSQAHVDGDEGVVGIMAKHVLEQGARPIFYYGQHYGGGGAIEAYLAAIAFWLFGVSVTSFKSVALGLSLASLPLVYAFCQRFFDRRVALTAVAILATATPLIEWHTKMRGGYAAIPVLEIAILFCYSAIVYEGRKDLWRPAAFGLLAGLAYYNQELLLPLLGVLAVVGLGWHRAAISRQGLLLLGVGVLIGAGPIFYYNFSHDFANVQHILESTRPDDALGNLLRLPLEVVPRFFVGQNADSLIAQVPAIAYLEYAIYAGLLASLPFGRPDSGASRSAPRRPAPGLVPLLGVYALVHLVSVAFSRGSGTSSRYLLPLVPCLAILAAVAIDRLLSRRASVGRGLGVGALGLLVGLGIWNHWQYVGPSRIRISVWTQPEAFENRETAGAAIPKIAALLAEAGVSHVRSTHFIQWRLAFESNEALIASSALHLPGGTVYPGYDAEVARAETAGESVAHVFHRESQHLKLPGAFVIKNGVRHETDLGSWLVGQGQRRVEIDEFVVFVPPEPSG